MRFLSITIHVTGMGSYQDALSTCCAIQEYCRHLHNQYGQRLISQAVLHLYKFQSLAAHTSTRVHFVHSCATSFQKCV
uniref:Uncharacterized protein n=1 Tax=Kuenenia stuttgartiensis TaxID=174633 RepID=Q1Q1Z0_KUEST|nr:unknown protein [Candidatus Kuenenia stuttgartiensis]